MNMFPTTSSNTRLSLRPIPLAISLALGLGLAACGGGDAEAPPTAAELAAPTVSITDSETGATARGEVTFLFAFSKNVGASFTADDVTVSGGSKGAFSMSADGKSATLVVTPAANTTGTLTVEVAAGKFSDGGGRSNTGAASKAQAYSTSTVVKTQMALPVSFDLATVDYALIGFAGAEDSALAADPTNAANQVARVVRAAGAESYAGTTVTAAAGLGLLPKIPFNTTDTRMSLRVWSPDAGITVRLKVEDHTDPNKSVETDATTTVAAGWQTLVFNFSNHAAGTSALNLGFNYDKATVFFDYGRAKAAAVQKTYYFDDLSFVPGSGGGAGGAAVGTALASFDEAVPPLIVEFGGAGYAIEAGPAGGSGNALKITRPGGEVFAGAFVTTTPIAFSATRKTITARVYSPTAGTPFVAKAEYADNTGSGDTLPTTAVVAGWQTLTWVFNNLDLTKAYTRFTILPNLGSVGTGQSYFIDDVTLAPESTVIVPPVSAADIVLASFDEATLPLVVEFGGAGYAIEAAPAGGSGNALKITRPGGEVYAGAFVTTAPIAFSATRRTITARVYSPAAGTPFPAKAEYADNTGSGDTLPTTAVVAGWQTLTWVFNNLDFSKAYTRFTILPNLGTVGTGQSYHVDDIKLLAASTSSGSSGAPVTIASLDEPGAVLMGFEGGFVTAILTEATVALENAACGSNSSNKVGKWIKPASNVANYAGFTVVTVANGGLPAVPFTASAKTMTLRVWSPDAGIPVRLKLEDVGDGSKFVEAQTLTTTAGGWQTLSFDFAAPVGGTLNLADSYGKATVFFDFGRVGSGKSYYFDDLTFVTGTGTDTVLASFDERVARVLTGFGGAENSAIVGVAAQPGGSSGPATVGAANTTRAVKVVKNAGETFAGTSVVAKLNDAVPTIPFASGATKMSLRVCSAYPAGMRVRMKVEKAGDPSVNSEVDAYTTTRNAWETLTFDFGPAGKHFIPNGPGPNGYDLNLPTSQLNLSQLFNKVNIFFDYGLGDGGYAPMPDTRVYYVDDVKFVGP